MEEDFWEAEKGGVELAVAGIIAEYNPFHRGHGWQVEELRRRLGADTAVVAAMSGNFVQRGDFALLNKHARAEAALMGGVDLVLELPTAWASATAEQFAWGGVSLLAATGVVTDLVFGSECGDLAALQAAARCLDSPDYGDALRRLLGEGMTFAKARQQAAEAIAGVELSCLGNPNDNLAVEYLRALRGQASDIQPLALPRQGAAHDSESATGFASASAIRRRILAGEAWRELVPPGTAAVIEGEMAAGRCPVTMQRQERAVLDHLRRLGEEEFRPYDGGNEGLYRRFYTAVRRAGSLEELLELAKTKRYALARLRRLLLHSYLGLTMPARGERPGYLRVLGANSRGRALLREMADRAALPVLTRPAQVRQLDEGVQAAFDREARYTDLYTLAYPDLSQSVPDREFTCPPVMR